MTDWHGPVGLMLVVSALVLLTVFDLRTWPVAIAIILAYLGGYTHGYVHDE